MYPSRSSISTRASRRLALGATSLLAAVCLGLFAAGPMRVGTDVANAVGGPPNIVLIQADDQTLGQFNARTMPNTMRLLARHGTTFRNYIATTAQCCPSRASLITGQYAHNDGVTSNDVGYPGLVDKNNVLPVWLQQAGYLTFHVGKFMNGYQHFARPPRTVPPGWDQWYSYLAGTRYYDYDMYINGGVVHRGEDRQANATTVANQKAVQLIHEWASKAVPMYLQLDEPAPHVAGQKDPFGKCGHVPIPEPRDEGAFKNAPLPRPPSYNERDMSDKPPFLRSAPKLNRAGTNRVRHRWRCALAATKGVDRGVARVYQAIKKAGLLTRTVFIFISDNGQFYGEHRIAKGKVFPYQEALHLPLVISAPRRYLNHARPLRNVLKPVANIDLAPTILSFAHGQPCPPSGPCRTLDGRSLKPLLRPGGKWPRQRGLLTEYKSPSPGKYATCQFAGIITRDTTYVEHSRVGDPRTGKCVSTDEVERYNRKRDPYELHNRCFGGRPGRCPHNANQADLESRLDRLRQCAGIRGRDERVDGRPFCE
jgi:arylsulfatase A-like enzyme